MSAAREYERFDEERAELRERAEKAEAELEIAKANALAILAMKQTSDDEAARLSSTVDAYDNSRRKAEEERESFRQEVARLSAERQWRESAKVDPSHDGWIFGRWLMRNGRHEIHMVHWSESTYQRAWKKLDDGLIFRDPKWWMPIPPLEPK